MSTVWLLENAVAVLAVSTGVAGLGVGVALGFVLGVKLGLRVRREPRP